ncbi:MAG: hypothetical protein A3F84_10340 [Candidatus Handelsmanbacteria bacterium RIFCSPLOWO2_12_FULL_64_10]|uniref:Phospholipase C/D domain-containing protein n=1 Tax=Handelsmanbacteria sp. (strain RIFCSPLOWO2_12_FULL_64_10) TaxID=1817868 RepID=A0A1F6D5E5_HANXR|nr:MAG: hypothetical protein A3F84_10340 [Candidatus Handelsmanbacteria bacterium RIFCSPLOWO2_12_FULL_64_10]
MSENVTHTAVLDDCFRLMLASDEVCEAFKEVGRTQRGFARLGGVTRSGDRFTVQLLTDFRARWKTRRPEDRLEPKLGFALGWLCHRAADRQMKPVFREAEPGRTESPSECSVYHDAFLFREVYAGGKEGPYQSGMFEEGPAGAEDLFRTLLQRALVGLHTFIPDREDVEGWLGRLFALQQGFEVDLKRYAAAISRPDPEKVRRFITAVNFYDATEPIIAAARGIQRGEPVTAGQVREAARAEALSHYAQALRMGYGYLCAASDFFAGDMSPEALRERLDVGRPGRDGKGV